MPPRTASSQAVASTIAESRSTEIPPVTATGENLGSQAVFLHNPLTNVALFGAPVRNATAFTRNVASHRVYTRDKLPKWKIRLQNYLVNDGPKLYVVAAWTVMQIIVFVTTYTQYRDAPDYSVIRLKLKDSLPVARGAAGVLNLCCCFMLLTVCRNLISALRGRFRVLDDHIEGHKLIGISIAFWTFVHVSAHCFNFLHFRQYAGSIRTATPEELAFLSGPGATGQAATVIFFLIFTSSLSVVRRKYFEQFWFTHHLIVVWFGVLCVHGTFGFVTKNDGSVQGPNFWKWWLPSATIYCLERLLRHYRMTCEKTHVSKVIQHPSKVVEVQIKKPSARPKAGQYIFVTCPELGAMESHPFTLTSAPEEDFLSVHIRVVGDWTSAFARRLGCNFDGDVAPKVGDDARKALPRVWVDGPYGSASEDVFNYEVAVCVGAGIGVTPFASILKSIWYKVQNPLTYMRLRKCYFFWICREKDAFEWFQDLLMSIEEEDIDHFLEIHTFLTGGLKADEIRAIVYNEGESQDGLTGLRSRTVYGRPEWESIFPNIAANHPGADIGVFFCGPKPLGRVLHSCSNRFTDAQDGGVKFFYHHEHF